MSHSMGSDSMLMRPKRFSTAVITRSCTSWLLMPSVVATWGDCFTVAAVEGEGDPDLLLVVAADLEAVGAPSDVRTFDSDLTLVETIIDRSGVAHQ